MVVKTIMRYIKGIEDYGLYYKKNKKFELRAYIDVDWAGNIDDRKNTSREEFFLGKRLVTWTRKKQNCISQSSVEVEYAATMVNCTLYGSNNYSKVGRRKSLNLWYFIVIIQLL